MQPIKNIDNSNQIRTEPHIGVKFWYSDSVKNLKLKNRNDYSIVLNV